MGKVSTVPSSAVTVSTPERRYSVLGVAMISTARIRVVVTAPVHVSGERFVDDGLADRGPRHVALGAPRVAALLEGHHLHDTHIGHLAVDGRAVRREPDFGGRQGDAGSRIDAQFPGILVTSARSAAADQERYDSCFHLL